VSWWEDLDCDRSRDREKAERLANVIARLGGSREEKVSFLTVHMALMEADAEREGHEPGSRAFGGMMKSLAFRYWRKHRKDQPRASFQSENWDLPEERLRVVRGARL